MRQGGGKVALFPQRSANPSVRERIVRIEAKRRTIVLHCFGNLTLLFQHGAKIALGVGLLGVETERLAVMLRRLNDASLPSQRVRQIVMCVGQEWIVSHGLPVLRE